MPSDPLEALDAQIASLREEHSQKAIEVRDLQIKIAALLEFRPQLEAAGRPATGRSAPPIRAIVRGLLEEWGEPFAADHLVGAVQGKEPSAKESSVRAELSHCKRSGLVEQLGRDLYRSLVHIPDEQVSEDTDEQPESIPLNGTTAHADVKETTTYGPRPGFGRTHT